MEIFLVIWLWLHPLCGQGSITEHGNQCDGIIKSQIVTQIVNSESEITEVYQKHKDDGMRVWRISYVKYRCPAGHRGCIGALIEKHVEIAELTFKDEPCGKWVEKDAVSP